MKRRNDNKLIRKSTIMLSAFILMSNSIVAVHASEPEKLSESYEYSIQILKSGDQISVEYPVLISLDDESAFEYLEEINQNFRKNAEDAVAAEQESMEENRMWILESGNTELADSLRFETTCESVYLLGPAYSVMQSHYTYTGGAHPYSWVTGVTYDLSTGEEMTMGEILGCGEDTAKEAVVLAYREHIIDQVEFITEQSIRDSFDAMEYWFDEEGMRVSLAPYIVASYAAGPQDVLVTQDHVAQARG